MAKHQGPNDIDESFILPIRDTKDFSHDAPSRKPTPDHGQPQASNRCWKMPTYAGISSALNPWWNKMLVTSCVIAVLFDPLFFYIPYTSDENKCMGRDKRVQTAALVFRSVTDIAFLVHIIYQLHVAITFAASSVSVDESSVFRYELVSRDQMIQFAKAFSHQLSWRSFLTDVLSILPLPQLLIVGLFFDIGGKNYLLRRKILSGFLLIQYLPRVYRIYLSSPTVTESALWLRGVFNLFLYILASHALGAFWYFFSIQRETSCWYRNCIEGQPESKCTFYCHDTTAQSAISSELNKTLDEKCILKVPYNMTDPPFDFGIFFGVLKNDIQGKINVPQKIGYCFWWGLRNLSNFGTSLETSTYLWENTFAVVISIIGLLLFLYLIGNVQIYMERATTRADEVREKLRIKNDDIENWMDNLGLEDDMKVEIRKNIRDKLLEDINADLDNLYSLLPSYTKKVVKRTVGMTKLRNVPILSGVDGKVLKMMCDFMKPVKYPENTMVFQMRDPLDRMIFITDGVICRYKTATDQQSMSSSHSAGETTTTESLVSSKSIEAQFHRKGDTYGLELLQYASSTDQLPTLVENVKCHTKVEALFLTITDLRNIAAIATLNGKSWPSFVDSQQDQVAQRDGQFQQQGLKKHAPTGNPTG